MLMRSRFAVALIALLAAQAVHADASDDAAARLERWHSVRTLIFGARPVAPGADLIRIEAPPRAQDAALVPVTITLPQPDSIAAIDLVVDDNPAPHAAHLRFGPGADRRGVSLRIRVDGYTYLHAVAERTDGSLVETAHFIKASGGCSAPIGVSDEEAMAGMGDMKLRLAPATADGSIAATLLVRHPNFSGMQMNQLTRLYTPARYVKTVAVSQGGRTIFTLDGDIALSKDPAIGFGFRPNEAGPVTVVVTDNLNSRWERRFPLTPAA